MSKDKPVFDDSFVRTEPYPRSCNPLFGKTLRQRFVMLKTSIDLSWPRWSMGTVPLQGEK